MKSPALLLIAHGSRRAEANDEIALLTDRLREAAGDQYGIIAHAFLEIAEPSIADAVADCVGQGAEEIVAVPYFLAAGRHVQEDIPAHLKEAEARHPGLRVRLCKHFGADADLPRLLLRLAGN